MEYMNQRTDDELVQSYLKGDNQSFDALLERCQSQLFSYIYFVVKDRDLADDLFQETFVKAIITMQEGKYTHHGKFMPWITRIAHNLIVDYFRKDKSATSVSYDDTIGTLLSKDEFKEQCMEDNMVQERKMEELRVMLSHLPLQQREVVYMRYYQDMSFKEIAEITHVSINTALGRMRYAILNMRKMVYDKNLF